MRLLLANALSTAMPSNPRSQYEFTSLEMSRIVVAEEPPGGTTFSRPSFSITNMRPSGAWAIAVGPVRPDTTVRSSNPDG